LSDRTGTGHYLSIFLNEQEARRMPQLIEHIDAIARKLQRDVLYLTFSREHRQQQTASKEPTNRTRIIAWLDQEKIAWQECGPVASENSFSSYAGQIFIDTPFDETNEQYLKVQAFLEHPDGTMRFEGVCFYVVPLEFAMKNAHHDEPGFWERWAENF